VPTPASDWWWRIDDVVHDIIAAANNAGALLKGVAATKRFKPSPFVDVIVSGL